VSQHRTSPCVILQFSGPHDVPPVLPPPSTLDEALAQLPTEQRWAIDYIDAPTGTSLIHQAIVAGQCFAVTDGSLKNGTGTSAFTLVGPTDEGQIKAVNVAPGPLKDGDSYRCELAGLYGVITLAQLVCTLHAIPSGSIHVRCDNQSSLRVFAPWFIPDPSDESFDLVNGIWQLLRESPLTFTAEHVKGHQDRHADIQSLERFERLNVAMDALATTYRLDVTALFPGRPAPQIPIYKEGWSIWNNGDEKLATPQRPVLYDRIYAPIIQRYWSTSHYLSTSPRIPPVELHSVDWEATALLMKSLPGGKQRWCTKHGSGHCGVGITLKSWKQQDDDECPRCQVAEDTTHVLRCTAHGATDVWNASVEKLWDALAMMDTPDDLRDAIIARLNQWRADSPLHIDPSWSESLRAVIISQDSLGWKNFLEGIPSILFRHHITHHYSSNGIDRSVKTWLRKVLQLAHDIAWNQWQHRNKILHEDDKPRMKRGIALLDQEICSLYVAGGHTLPAADQYHFQIPIDDLLNRSVQYKQHWYVNVIAAQKRQFRRDNPVGPNQDNDPDRDPNDDDPAAGPADDDPGGFSNPRLLHWIRTGRLQ
jgi:hypothetical protein